MSPIFVTQREPKGVTERTLVIQNVILIFTLGWALKSIQLLIFRFFFSICRKVTLAKRKDGQDNMVRRGNWNQRRMKSLVAKDKNFDLFITT